MLLRNNIPLTYIFGKIKKELLFVRQKSNKKNTD